MEVVIDTSITISALLKEGLTRRIIFIAPFELYTIPYARQEIENHRNELVSKSKLDEEAFQYLLDLIFNKVHIVEPDVFQSYKNEATEIMREIDINDSPFVALALCLGYPIWSNDNHFKQQDVVTAYTTKDIIRLLQEADEGKN